MLDDGEKKEEEMLWRLSAVLHSSHGKEFFVFKIGIQDGCIVSGRGRAVARRTSKKSTD
jgi:hypothetical protein